MGSGPSHSVQPEDFRKSHRNTEDNIQGVYPEATGGEEPSFAGRQSSIPVRTSIELDKIYPPSVRHSQGYAEIESPRKSRCEKDSQHGKSLEEMKTNSVSCRRDSLQLPPVDYVSRRRDSAYTNTSLGAYTDYEEPWESLTEEEIKMAYLVQKFFKGYLDRKLMTEQGLPTVIDDFIIDSAVNPDYHSTFSPSISHTSSNNKSMADSMSATSIEDAPGPSRAKTINSVKTFWGAQSSMMDFGDDTLIPLSPNSKK